MSAMSLLIKDPAVYVVVLNWNGWRDTIRCLDALALGTYPDLHVVVVDNGSTDDSVEELRRAYPKLSLLETGQNLGFAGGSNPGIRHAIKQNADFIWLLNNDTEPEPDALTHMVRRAQSDPHIGSVGSVLLSSNRTRVLAWGGGRVNRWMGYSRHATGPENDRWFDYITAASMLVPRKAFEQIGLLDERYFLYWEDIEFGFRLRRNGWRLAVASDSRVIHKENGSTEGNRSILTRYSTVSAMRFLIDYSPLSGVSAMLFLTMRVTRRIFTGHVKDAIAVVQAGQSFLIDLL
jgi:GT2 family glycosyltransferase